MCVFVYVCHLANLSQSPGSDKNVAALRGHTLEWNEVRGASVVKPNLLRGGGGAVGTLNIPLDLDHRIYMCVCVYVSACVHGGKPSWETSTIRRPRR